MNPLPFILLAISLPLLLGGCGEKEINSNLKYKNLKYKITSDSVTITGCDNNASGELVIPDTIKGKPVTTIGKMAFFRNGISRSLTSITIPDSVTSIEEKAFYLCSSLTSIAIPDGVTTIERDAFSRCRSLTSITIPDSVTSIGENAFYLCKNLTSITIPDSVTSIGESAFSFCKSLTSIEIPDGVTSIGERAFGHCTSLTSITIPDGVTSIEERAFYECFSLTSISIPNSVITIERSAFNSCTSLTSITIPKNVTFVRKDAFDCCWKLTAVTFLGDAPEMPEIKGYVFWDRVTIYRRPDAKGWGDKFAGRPVKLIGEAPSEKLIADTAQAKSGKKFPSSTKELMFGSNPVVTHKDKAFWEAAKSGNLEVVQRLFGEGVDVDIYGSTVGVDFGCTALFWAAKHNHKEVVQFLLDKDAYIDAGAGMGGAPLHIAAYEGHSEIVELLISEGANAEAKTGDGKTVLDFANEEIATLINKRVDEKKPNNNP
jgi:hypothetical protein